MQSATSRRCLHIIATPDNGGWIGALVSVCCLLQVLNKVAPLGGLPTTMEEGRSR